MNCGDWIVARRIEHQAAPAEARRIVDLQRRDFDADRSPRRAATASPRHRKGREGWARKRRFARGTQAANTPLPRPGQPSRAWSTKRDGLRAAGFARRRSERDAARALHAGRRNSSRPARRATRRCSAPASQRLSSNDAALHADSGGRRDDRNRWLAGRVQLRLRAASARARGEHHAEAPRAAHGSARALSSKRCAECGRRRRRIDDRVSLRDRT